ncbi:MAG: nucleotide exchange factor GrpE [Alphaproteobacteria bacterium]|nr:nucleotide exchange factor GrpE [Alphaproteobacteria bacterium]
MSDHQENPQAPLDAPQSDAVEGAAPPKEAGAAEPPSEVKELKDQLLRALAEAENVRKRAERDKVETQLYGIAKFARDLLSVSDNLRRALDALPAEARAAAPDAVRNLFTGIEATERELQGVFERHGVKPLNPVGEKFNPNLHQAIAEVPTTTQPPGTVVAVMQTGYMIGERLLRAAMVTVARADAAKAGPGSSVDTTA